jgi:diguanylate cyclase (GGDEF)-like protein/PAS domain S-box-containing protein
MTSPAMEQARRVTTCLLLFALVAGAGVLSKLYTRDAQGVSTVWVANGLMLGYLLYAARRQWVELQVAGALGQMASGLLAGDSATVIIIPGLINAGEVLVAALPLRAAISSARELSLPANFVRFLAWAVLGAPLLSGLLLVGSVALFGGPTSLRLFSGWFAGHALGMATVVPVTLALCDKELARLFRREHLPEVLLGLALIVVATFGVFWQDDYPLLYLVFPPMLLAALRGGFAGTAFALLLVVAIAAPLTSMGHGPLMLKATGLPGTVTYLLLQCFIASLLLTCFPMAVAMSTWRRNQNTERRLRHRLRLLADHSSDVIVLCDLDGRRLYVSPAVREMLGWEPEEFLRGSFRDLVPASHLEAMEQQVAQLAANLRGKATITFPARRKDGRPLWVEARIKHFRDAGFLLLDTEQAEKLALNRGRSGEEGFVVTLRDITRRRQAELALEDANRELASLVRQDSLTGLANRRHFDERLAECWERCLQAGKPLAVVLLDVDFFKRYNDHYGHQMGDQCLASVASTIAGSLRGDADCAARYGGEEFALILPATTADEAQAVAERIRRGIERLALPHAASPYFRLTVSIGLASVVPGMEGKATELLVKAADEALYASKTQGRNRVTAYDTLVPPVTESR